MSGVPSAAGGASRVPKGVQPKGANPKLIYLPSLSRHQLSLVPASLV